MLYCHNRVKELLPSSLSTGFEYIRSLQFEDKPDYNFIKLLLTCNEEDEPKVFSSKLNIPNN